MQTIHQIKEIIRESPNTKTYVLDGKINYNPGQFIMLWLPGIDEKPLAVSNVENNQFSVTIECKGNFTNSMCHIKEGTQVGVRGPYGNGFTPKDNSIIVAGGLGMAPAVELIKRVKNSTIIQGAKSKDFLLFLNNKELTDIIKRNGNKIIYCTDDGSFGVKGFVTNALKETINKNTKTIYTIGPEIMIQKVFELCEKNKIDCQASLERYMRCCFGVCGACVCGDQLVCKDGPVFNSEQLRKMEDFGKSARLKSGRKVPLNEYFSYRSK